MSETEKIKSEKLKIPTGHMALGMPIKISPKSRVSINKAGLKVEYFVETISVLIGIGKDHTAELIMDKDAWEALNNGEQLHITTMKEWHAQYSKPIKRK